MELLTPPSLSPPAATWLVHLQVERVMARLLPALEQAGIPTFLVKGFVLAHTTYSDVAKRPLSDVDLRVPIVHLAALRRIATDLGFRVEQESRAYANLTLKYEGVSVDCETLIGPPFLTRLSIVECMDTRVQYTTRSGLAFWAPSPTNHALILAVNAFKDKFRGAASYALHDAREAIRASGFELDRFVERAKAAQMTTLVHCVARYFAARGDADWAVVQARTSPPYRRRTYVAAFERALASNHEGLATRMLARLASDSPLDALRALALSAAWEVETRARRWRSR